MDFDIVKKVIKIAEEADISGLAVQQGDFRVEVKREKGVYAVPSHPAPHHTGTAAAPVKKNEEEEEVFHQFPWAIT